MQISKELRTKKSDGVNVNNEFNRIPEVNTDTEISSSGTIFTNRFPGCIANINRESPPQVEEHEGQADTQNDIVLEQRIVTMQSTVRDSKRLQQRNGRQKADFSEDDSLVACASPIEKGADLRDGTTNTRAQDGVVPRKKKLTPKREKNSKKQKSDKVDQFPVKCRGKNKCKESFANWDAMLMHLNTFHAKGTKKTFVCFRCNKTVSEYSRLKLHMNSAHGYKSYVCPIPKCSRKYTNQRSLDRHTFTAHSGKEFKCSKCSVKFYSEDNLRIHLAKNHDQTTLSRKQKFQSRLF